MGYNMLYLPKDLLNFIQRDTYSLLVKGHAGTGKTTLALTILNAIGIESNFFYISTRISPKQLFEYYPWLGKFVMEREARSESITPKQELTSSFEDARLDEPESLFERITNHLMDTKSPIIVIDSWDAIASFMDREARLNNERVLQTWRERAGAKLILISEQPADTTLDFTVDGIVELQQSYHGIARMRRLFLLKLRGTRICRPSYLYTLENTMFHCFEPYQQPIKFEQREKIVTSSTQILSHGYIPSGYSNLDAVLGCGFPRKSMALIELDSSINRTIIMLFLKRILSSFILNGNPVFFQPIDWVDPSMILHFINTFIPAGKRDLFKILWKGKSHKVSNNIVSSSRSHDSALTAATVKLKRTNPEKFVLNFVWMDAIQRLYGAKRTRDRLKKMLPSMKSEADLSIVVITHPQEDILGLISEVSDVRLRFVMVDDTLILQSLVPSSNLYSVEVNERADISLVSVV